MNQEIGRLIDECKQLEPEIHRLLLMQLSFYPPWMIRKVKRISKEKLAELIKEGKNLGGLAEVEKNVMRLWKNIIKFYQNLQDFWKKKNLGLENLRAS